MAEFQFGTSRRGIGRPAKQAPRVQIDAQVEATEAAEAEPDMYADVEYVDELQADTLAELDALQTALAHDRAERAAYNDRRDRETLRFAEATDGNYYSIIVFRNEAYRDAFWHGLTKQPRALFERQFGSAALIDGHKMWNLLGFEVPPGEYRISGANNVTRDVLPPPGLGLDE